MQATNTKAGGRWNTLLFAAADDERRLANAHRRGADAIILDLEDAVPVSRKARARAGLAAAATALAERGQDVVVRINAGWLDAVADLEAAMIEPVRAIIVPKVEDAGRLIVISAMIAEWEIRRGLAAEGTGLIALIESPLALGRLDVIAAVPRVSGMALGSEDFSLELGVEPTSESLDLPCRMIALAAATRRLMALGLPISIAGIADMGAYAAAAARGRAIGMTGSLCIHPNQVSVIAAAFAVDAAALSQAKRILAAWEAAGDSGLATLDGKMVDLPVVQRARATLERSTTDRGSDRTNHFSDGGVSP